jgi:hypothetical protein
VLVRGGDPERNVFGEPSLDPSREVLTDAVGIEENGEHHRRVIGGTTTSHIYQCFAGLLTLP